MKKILITGANGYLASYIRKENINKFEWIEMTRKNADFSNPLSVEAYLQNIEFDICFHTAANATTAICEENPELAHKINVESTQKIIEACIRNKARLIFCSTEQVFNGKSNSGPFHEDEPLESVTVYGQNKIECEKLIQSQLSNYLILRFSWMMGLSFPDVKASPSIVKNVINALTLQKPTFFTCNEKRCMTYAKHLAKQFMQISQLPSGIYHAASSNDMTTYSSAVYIAKQLGAEQETIDKLILPNTKRYSDRFRDYRLDSSKLEKNNIHFGSFKEDIQEILNDFGWR